MSDPKPKAKSTKPKPARAIPMDDAHSQGGETIPMDDAHPLRQPGRQGTTRKERERLPVCGAKTSSGKRCQNPAGKGTNHPGEGRCKFHGGATQIKGTRFEVGRYGDLRARPRLKELIEKYSREVDTSDLSHEITLLRALVHDYVERYDDMSDALLAWHASYSSEFEEAMGIWRKDVAAYVEATAEQGQEPERPFPQPPQPGEFQRKPRQIIDMIAVSALIDKVGGMSDRIEKRKRQGTITLALLDQTLERLGMEVVYAAKEVRLDDVTRAALLAVIERRWHAVRVDPATGTVQGPEESARGPLH